MKKISIAIVAWMVLLVGGWILLSGDPSPESSAQVSSTASSEATPAVSATDTPPATTASPEPSVPAEGVSPGASTTPVPGEVAPSSDTGASQSYSAQELDALRTSDPDLYQKLTVDPQDSNPVLSEQIDERTAQHPAFQRLPYSKGSVSVDFTGKRVGDRIELEVLYSSGTRSEARAVVSRFLSSADDTAAGYVIRYRKI